MKFIPDFSSTKWWHQLYHIYQVVENPCFLMFWIWLFVTLSTSVSPVEYDVSNTKFSIPEENMNGYKQTDINIIKDKFIDSGDYLLCFSFQETNFL